MAKLDIRDDAAPLESGRRVPTHGSVTIRERHSSDPSGRRAGMQA